MPLKSKIKSKEYFQEYYIENKEKKKQQAKLYYLKNKDKVLAQTKVRHLLKQYGLTIEAYNDQLQKQNYVCAICNQVEISKDRLGRIKPLSVDHCHTTGKLRKLLCNNCNFILGYSKNDVAILKNCINYLEEFLQCSSNHT